MSQLFKTVGSLIKLTLWCLLYLLVCILKAIGTILAWSFGLLFKIISLIVVGLAMFFVSIMLLSGDRND